MSNQANSPVPRPWPAAATHAPVDLPTQRPRRPLTRIACFGDSVMWGQGLERADRFSQQIVDRLTASSGTPGTIVHDLSRSGARITVPDNAADATRNGVLIKDHRSSRHDFVSLYPHLFAGDADREAFVRGDEHVAHQLDGEVPASFPTVTYQVAALPDALGAKVDLALVNGGNNDVDIEGVATPTVVPHRWVETYDPLIRDVAFVLVRGLLTDVRRKCPQAVILFFGVFAPVSSKTDHDAVMRMIQTYTGASDAAWYLNSLTKIKGDPEDFYSESQARCLWWRGRFSYWARRAVVDVVRNDDLRGPGVLYVPAGFHDENSILAARPFLWSVITHPTTDPARQRRLDAIPRYGRDGLIYDHLRGFMAQTDRRPGNWGTPSNEIVQTLVEELDGPVRLQEAVGQLAIDGQDFEAIDRARTEIASELSRIEHARIASFSHPNGKGASSYATQGLRRLERHHAVVQRLAAERLHPPAVLLGESIDALLRRCGLRSTASLSADATHLDVDSLSVLIDTAEDSGVGFAPSVFLRVTTTDDADGSATTYELTFPSRYLDNRGRQSQEAEADSSEVVMVKTYPWLEPGARNRFAVDTMGDLSLEAITSTWLLIGEPPLARAAFSDEQLQWRPRRIELEVNGVSVRRLEIHAHRPYTPGSRLDLGWPPPAPTSPGKV